MFIVVSTVFALDPVMAFVGYTGRLDGLLTFFFYFAIFFMGHGCRNLKDSFFQGIALSSLIVASFTISEALGYRPYTNAVYREIRFLQPVSSMGNRNFLGTYLATTPGRGILTYLVILGIMALLFAKLPSAFIPEEDQGVFVTIHVYLHQ